MNSMSRVAISMVPIIIEGESVVSGVLFGSFQMAETEIKRRDLSSRNTIVDDCHATVRLYFHGECWITLFSYISISHQLTIDLIDI